MDEWYPIQDKQKDKVGRPDVDSFEAVMMREDCKKGFFVAFDYSSDALTEIDAFFRKTSKVVIALTVKEILDEQIARKLAWSPGTFRPMPVISRSEFGDRIRYSYNEFSRNNSYPVPDLPIYNGI